MITVKDEETEAQKGEDTCSRSHSGEVANPRLDGEAGFRVVILANKLGCLFRVHKDSLTLSPSSVRQPSFPSPHLTGAFKAEYGLLIN